ncbi:hypothetical protein J3458_009466 [Metarhizium acridum]|uniref:uncharacterized protein n=1 Tax=Metarhizium acridum TaxID=92637 RepID=UPI001C6BA4A6|nr:hypothetical protein J3458_009466 [Metarhizium acridum]
MREVLCHTANKWRSGKLKIKPSGAKGPLEIAKDSSKTEGVSCNCGIVSKCPDTYSVFVDTFLPGNYTLAASRAPESRRVDGPVLHWSSKTRQMPLMGRIVARSR